MSKVINFPVPTKAEVINEDHFEQFGDAALMLAFFEKVAEAVEWMDEGGSISRLDDHYVGLVETCMALAVLFRRRTGHTVQEVCSDHLEEQRRRLMAGEELKELMIPVRESAIKPLPSSAFKGLGDLELAQAGFNYVRRVSEQIRGNCPHLVELGLARAHSVDALNAFSLLISRLADGAVKGVEASLSAISGPSSETLQ